MPMCEVLISKLNNFINNKIELNEENTKMSLILPFLQEQGYNVFDLNELQSEYVTDMRNNGGEKVDYAVMENNLPIIFIEAKPLGVQLYKYIGQLQRYYVADKEVKYGILTDGQHYWFFADDERANIMDEKPFYKIDLLNLKDIDLEFLKLFTKESIKDIDNIEHQRNSLKLKYFIENSIKNPDEDFIGYISKRLGVNVEKEEVIKLLNSDLESKKEVVQVKKVKEIKEKLRNSADKPETYVLDGDSNKFVSWKFTLYTILNKVIEDKGSLECVKEQVHNTGNFGILKTSDHKYNYKQLANGEYMYLQLSAKEIKRIIRNVLKGWGKEESNIEYKYK